MADGWALSNRGHRGRSGAAGSPLADILPGKLSDVFRSPTPRREVPESSRTWSASGGVDPSPQQAEYVPLRVGENVP